MTNRGLTEDTGDRGMWIYLVFGEGRPQYSGQPFDEGVKLCTLYSECSSGVQTVCFSYASEIDFGLGRKRSIYLGALT